METKVLYIYWDGDYWVVEFEDNVWYNNIKKFMKENNLKKDGDSYSCEDFNVELKIFKWEISQEFENFIKKKICSYDSLNHTSFFVIR